MVDPLLNAALGYAERGWHVVPLHSVDTRGDVPVCSCPKGAACGTSAGKHPRMGAWQHEASSDPAQIKRWWAQWPGSNIGLCTCQPQSRLVAIDVDGEEGRRSLQELEARFEELPPTLTSISGRADGGAHLVFRVPDGRDMEPLRGRSGTVLGPGIDVRGMGGQIVVAPSMHYEGRPYQWDASCPHAVADLPTWLYVLLTVAPQKPTGPPPAARRAYVGEISAWAQAALDDELRELAGTSTRRHTAVYNAASKLGQIIAGGGLPEDLVRGQLRVIAHQIGLPQDEELERQIERGFVWGRSNPRAPSDPGRPPGPRRPPEPPPIHEDPIGPPPPGGDDDGGGGGGAWSPGDDGILWSTAADGTRWGIEFGVRVAQHKVVPGDATGAVWVYGYNLWPESHTVDIETGQGGVRLAFRDPSGRLRHHVLSAASWVDKNFARKAAGDIADAGATIAPGKGAQLILLVGKWAMATRGQPGLTTEVIHAQGWHDGNRVWVNGPHVHGAPWIWDGDAGGRGQIAGTVEDWLREVGPLVTTPGLRFALGVALAGSLLEPLRAKSFLVHLCGASTSGKSIAGALASSVWGDPSRLELRWNTTEGALAARLEQRSGASAVIDEVQQQESTKLVGRILHALAGGEDKDRLTRAAQLRTRRSWSLSALSTGEVSLQLYLGASGQGGHTVRGLDIPIQRGELTEDAGHAVSITRATSRCYGAVGDAWGAWLCQLDDAAWAHLGSQVKDLTDGLAAQMGQGEDKELPRGLVHVALCGVALAQAAAVGLAPDMGEGGALAIEAAAWAASRIVQSRGKRISPPARAWAQLRRLYETQPYRFPDEDQFRRGARDVIAISEVAGQVQGGTARTGWAWATHRMLLIEEVIHQCTPDDLLTWAKEHQLAHLNTQSKSRKSRVAGETRAWWKLKLGEDAESTEDEEDDVIF